MKLTPPKPTSNAAAIAKYYEAALSSARPSPNAKHEKLFVTDERGSYVVSNDAAARAIDQGLRATIVQHILDAVSVEPAKVFDAIGIDKATLRRREGKGKLLDGNESAGAIRTIELHTLAAQVFGTSDKAAVWLNKPHPLFDGKSPMEVASNEYGVAKVKSMLFAIRYGGVV